PAAEKIRAALSQGGFRRNRKVTGQGPAEWAGPGEVSPETDTLRCSEGEYDETDPVRRGRGGRHPGPGGGRRGEGPRPARRQRQGLLGRAELRRGPGRSLPGPPLLPGAVPPPLVAPLLRLPLRALPLLRPVLPLLLLLVPAVGVLLPGELRPRAGRDRRRPP